jgi:hypothetical protein
MERKYLMIDSTYRDRLLYPSPAEFIIPINSPIGNSIWNSKNPTATGYPIFNFGFLNPTDSFTGVITGGNPKALAVATTINNLTGIGVPGVSTTLDNAVDMFVNLSLTVAGDANTYTITGYDPVRCIIYLDTPILTAAFVVGANYTIINPSTSSSIVLQGYKLSVNGFPISNDGFFLSSSQLVYVWDLTINEIRSGYLTNANVNLTQPFSAGWSVSDDYIISVDTNPTEYGFFNSVVPTSPILKSGVSRFIIMDPGKGYTNQMDVEIVSQVESRPAYAIGIGKVVFTNTTSGVSRMDLLYCGDQYIMNVEYFLLPVGEVFRPGLATVKVLSTAVGFVVDSPTTDSDVTGSYMIPLIMTPEFTYDNLTNTVSISPNASLPYRPNRIIKNVSMIDAQSLNGLFPIVRTLFYQNKKIIMTQPATPDLYKRLTASNIATFPEAYNYYVVPYDKDGCVSMDYRGTFVSSNQMVCYGITVNTLILPNQILNLPFGSLTSSYPYVLLEITNETASSGHNKAVIYSNNPNTVSATFVCSISDINSPTITKFININSDRSTQVVKFKPNDNLKLSIKMPDGRTFETEIKDYMVPLSPNPLLQINCLIEIIRL